MCHCRRRVQEERSFALFAVDAACDDRGCAAEGGDAAKDARDSGALLHPRRRNISSGGEYDGDSDGSHIMERVSTPSFASCMSRFILSSCIITC